jgi:hypothetical protein
MTKKNEWNFLDLNSGVLNYIEIDYLSLTLHGVLTQNDLESKLRSIKSDLRILDVNRNEKLVSLKKEEIPFTCEELQVVQGLNSKKFSENKYIHKKFDLIYYRYYNKTSEVYKQYVRIPGSLSHQLISAVLLGEFKLDDYHYSITRIDFKVKIPQFSYNGFHSDLGFFLDFNGKQPLERTNFDERKQFALGYIGKRTSRRMVRTYLTGLRSEKTFELECKKESSKLYSEFLLKGDAFNFNKTLVLELLEVFKKLVECPFTEPLHDWCNSYLKPIKTSQFPESNYYQRIRVKKDSIIDKPKNKTIKQLVSTKNSLLNFNLASSFKSLDSKTAFYTFILSFLSKKLINKWFLIYQNLHVVSSFIHQSSWNDHQILNKSFLTDERFFIEFELSELLRFLNITNRTESRIRIINDLKSLTEVSLEFWVKDRLFYQPFLYSLELIHKRGVPTRISLTLHPYAVYELLEFALIINNHELGDLYKIVEKYKSNEQKRSLSSMYLVLFQCLHAFHCQNSNSLKSMLALRHLKKPNLRERHIDLFYELLENYQNKTQLVIGALYKGLEIIPVHKNFLHQILSRSTNKHLNQTEFFFKPKNQVLLIEK